MLHRSPVLLAVVALLAAQIAITAAAGQKVIRLRLDGPVPEVAVDDDLALLMGGSRPTVFRNLIDSVHDASRDAEIAGIALILESPQMSLAQIEELWRALRSFRNAGKKVYCYLDYADNGTCAIASAADHVTLAEHSELSIFGLRADLWFYKGMFDKFGIHADMLHAGDYKAALEPFTRTEPSPFFAENINWILDSTFDRWIEMISQGRGLSDAAVRGLVDRAPVSASEALEARLVDAVGGFEEFQTLLRKTFGTDMEVLKRYPAKSSLDLDLDPSNPFAMFEFMNSLMEEMMGDQEDAERVGIGLIHVDGAISTGPSQSDPFGGSGVAGSTTIRAAFDKALHDDRIKAVVLRVDSPGGSALASDIIWRAAHRLAQAKPLIVSMGGVAGSGGYYVALPGDVIFAEATTLTGSIGVVGGKLVFGDLLTDKLGITTAEFTRGGHAHLFSETRVWSEDDRVVVRGWLDQVYEQFKGRVMASRGSRLKGDIKDLAEGRVFTGQQALERGLVDRIGGLTDAIALAAERAGLKDPPIHVLPRPTNFGDVLAMMLDQPTEDDFDLRAEPASPSLSSWMLPLLNRLSPEATARLRRDLLQLDVLQSERAACFMPVGLSIR